MLAAAAAGEGGGLTSLQVNLMFWTLVIFLILFYLLRRFAFPPIFKAVEAREKALEDAIAGAKRDRDEAAKLLEEHRRQIENARGEAQRFIAEGRQVAERMRADLLEQARREQQEMLERARREIEVERDRAIMDLRREAVDLAIAGASKVVEQNLDSAANRRLVESFLASVSTIPGDGKR
jgi:F-type H+-transporting ATPase subunit b